MIKGIVLHASLFLVGDSSYQKDLIKENEELKLQIKSLRQMLPKKEYAGRAIVQSPILRGTKKSITKTQYILEDPNVQKLGSATPNCSKRYCYGTG